MNKQFEELQLELVTMKFMILSLYQGLVSDEFKDLQEWEEECKKSSKKYLEKIKEESESEK